MDDEEYKKLPVEEKCVHKLWKARVSGYEEVTKLFRQIDDEKSPEFSKYLGLVSKFVTDSNAVSQEKGLEAALAYVENYALAGKTTSDVMSGVVTKCIAAPKTKTRELALQLTLMYVEIEKYEAVQDELIKGMEQKNPKIVAACINACTTALREFGSKIITLKPLVKKIGVLFADRDKAVRDEAKQMVIEMYRWMGAALRPQLANLQPVQVTELETEFSKVDGQKATPTRYIRSQQQKQAVFAAKAEEVDGDDEEDEEYEDAPEMDPFEMADPVDILSKLPKDFYEKLEAKKWQERKEALETLEKLLKTPKLENGDYGDLVRALKKMVQKDSNVVVVACAGRCLASLASGLKKKFQSYAGACVPALLEKFKEKKQNVVVSLREAVDAVYLTTTVETVLDDVLEALNNKNPSVKIETALFLARAFTKTQPAALNKKLLKALTGALTKTINEPDPTVRESSAEALGTLMALVGEKAVGPFLVEVEKDNLKMSKIKECCDKAVITVKVTGVKKERPTTAPAKVPSNKSASENPKPPPRAAKRPTGSAAGKKKPISEISSGSATVVRSKPGKVGGKAPSKPIERELGDEEVEEIALGVVKSEVLTELVSANWKSRLAAVEQIMSEIQTMDSKSIPSQALVKTLSKKPGLRDTNFQVLKAKLDVVKYLAENSNFSTTTANCCIQDIAEKFGDPKNGTTVAETMTATAEATSLGFVSAAVMEFAFSQKSPKVMQEVLIWLASAIKEFGFNNLNAKLLIENSKKGLSSINPAVRQATIGFLGTLYLYMGSQLNVFFENEKAALRDQINAEFDKYEGEKPPPATRGVKKSASSNSLDAVEGDEGETETINVQDLLPRVDISGQITEALISELMDKNWKVRNEALTKISAILQENKFIKPNIGDLPQALSQRLTDSNVKIANAALNICEAIAKAMGPPCKQYIRTFFPGFLQGLGDSKSWMRTASLTTINAYAEQCGYKEFFDGEMIADAFKSGSPTLRIELWLWLAEKVPKISVKSIPKEELLICVPHLYNNLEDRNADVRKNANEAILGIMIHLGYDAMVKHTEKLKPGSKTVVLAALEKVRPNLPAKPLPKKSTSSDKEDKAVRGTKPVANSKNAVKGKGVGVSKSAPVSNRKKEEDVDTSPLLVANNNKTQRTIDENKLKVLKWNFTQPREEFVDLLKDQMASANVNKTLMSNMFHADFRYHIKALEALMDDMLDNERALIANLDLILKWLTLRFFDTNPSVLMKGLEYLHNVFNMLITTNYQMSENEAQSFIPYLVLKIGDPKDSVRNGVRSLLKQICLIHPFGRVFSYLMEGLKSKNARQRAECLECMSCTIEAYGITVCTPTPAACLKEVAKQISDRDNSVRSAALNCIVQAYYLVGEKVYKMVGSISDKDMSLLEERIKRSSKKAPKPKPEPMVVPILPQKQNSSPLKQKIEQNQPLDDDEMDDDGPQYDDELMQLPPQVIQEPPKEVSGPFKLDPEFMQELDQLIQVRPNNKSKLQEFDLDFLKEDIKVPSATDARAKVMPLSPPKPVVPNEPTNRMSLNMHKLHGSKRSEPLLEKTINQMGATDSAIALQSIVHIQEILHSPKGSLMIDYEDEFMSAVTTQLKHLSNNDPRTDQDTSKIYRTLLTVIDAFYYNKILGRHLTIPVLKSVINELISLLVEEKLENCNSGDAYVKVVNLHCVKIIERSDHTNIICALIQLIEEGINLDKSARHIDLTMKCLWRVIKLMPSWDEEINYEIVLLEVHNFLKKYPSSGWKNKPVDTPLRTIKTILHTGVKIKGSTLMLYLGKIPNTAESEVEHYILRLLKSQKIEAVKQVPLKSDVQRRSLSRANHNMLTDIFQKIGVKSETKEGLTLLYDFMQQHPEADIEPFLKKSSQFFQDYIKDGLKDIENSRRPSKPTIIEKVGDTCSSDMNITITNNGESGINAEYWKERLNMWNKTWSDLTESNRTPAE